MAPPFLLAALLVLAAVPAVALQCVAGDPLRAATAVRDASGTLALLHGHLAFDEDRMPDRPPRRWWWQGEPADGHVAAPPVAARFEGEALGPEGSKPLAAAVTLEPVCWGMFCGWLGEGTYLLVARLERGRYAVEVDPCGGPTFLDPSAAVINAVQACLAEGSCGP